MNRKLKKCSTCGADIAKTAKTCPQCGAKNVDLLPFWGMASVIFAIFLIFIAKDALNKDTEKPSNHSEVPYQDVIKTFSDLHDDVDISVKEINDRLGVVITCNDLNSSAAPENWDKMISNFAKYLEKGNKLADKYGLKILTAEIRAADGTVLASGGNGECTYNLFLTSSGQSEHVVAVTAKDLWEAYSENKVNADNLYKGKMLAVTGVIVDIGQDALTKAPCISLETGDGPICLYPIQCFFPKNGEQTDAIANLSDGDIITIYGKCDGTPLVYVQLYNCYF